MPDINNFNVQRVLTGSTGTVWINGIKLSELQSIEAKVAVDTEDVNVCGMAGKQNKITGWSGTGTVTLNKAFSRGLTLLGKAMQDGIQPDFKILTELKDTVTGQSERVSITNIVFTEFTLVNFAAKGVATEELPFNFGKYQILETISE